MKNWCIKALVLLLLMSCNESPKKEKTTNQPNIVTADKGAMQLTLDGKTYVYDDIDWDKSRVKYDGEDVRLALRQDRLPRVNFWFPDVHESLEQQNEFKIPDVLRGGKSGGYFNSPITLSFQVYQKPEDHYPKGSVAFDKGQLTSSFENGRLKVAFEGEGSTVFQDEKAHFPVSGTMDIKISQNEN